MIGRADIEGSKSNVAMNAWRHKPLIPVSTFDARGRPSKEPLQVRPRQHAGPALAAEQLEQPAKKLTGFGLGPRAHPLVANPFPGLRSILPTSLPTFFHRPQVVHLGDPMRYEYDRRERYSGPPIFKGRRAHRHHQRAVLFQLAGPYLRRAVSSGGQSLNVKDNSSRGPRRRLRLPNVAVNRRVPAQNFNPIPFRSSRETRFVRGYPDS
ncbi:hypothetical protein Syun_031940 [Stephania yunnanensis]|uniref:Uncharacterized protein n=1 Tax=Stephania yunnanensis TaxID=152371 RepID=A0AAP0DTK1_9MAGN